MLSSFLSRALLLGWSRQMDIPKLSRLLSDPSLAIIRSFGKINDKRKLKTEALVRKLERILIKLYREHVSLLSSQTYIYITWWCL